MTRLAQNVRNELAKDTRIRPLIGRSEKWPDGWVFVDDIYARIEGTQRCAIVITEDGTWTTMNAHNTLRFPRVRVDIWADPTRNSDGSVRIKDAKFKIEDVAKIVDKVMHLVNLDEPGGELVRWGSDADIEAGKGSVITGSTRTDGPDFRPLADTEGGFMGSYVYAVNTL